MSNINAAYTIIGSTTIGSTTVGSTLNHPPDIYSSEDYLHKCELIKELLTSVSAFYQVLHNGTEEENLLALQMFSKKFERIRKLSTEAIDLIENRRSVHLA